MPSYWNVVSGANAFLPSSDSSHHLHLQSFRVSRAAPVLELSLHLPAPTARTRPAVEQKASREDRGVRDGPGGLAWSDVDEQSESQRRSFSCTKLSSLLAEKAQYLQRFVASLPAPVAVLVASLLARTPLLTSEVVGNMPATPSPLTVSFLPNSFSETRFLTVRAASPCVDRHAVRVAHAELLHLAEAADGHG